MALEARQAILDNGLVIIDMPHMTHGILKVLIVKRKNAGSKSYFRFTREIYDWIKVEFGEIRAMLKSEKSLATDVYLTGFLADVFYLFPPLTWPAGLIGYIIAKKGKLGMRLKQSPFGK